MLPPRREAHLRFARSARQIQLTRPDPPHRASGCESWGAAHDPRSPSVRSVGAIEFGHAARCAASGQRVRILGGGTRPSLTFRSLGRRDRFGSRGQMSASGQRVRILGGGTRPSLTFRSLGRRDGFGHAARCAASGQRVRILGSGTRPSLTFRSLGRRDGFGLHAARCSASASRVTNPRVSTIAHLRVAQSRRRIPVTPADAPHRPRDRNGTCAGRGMPRDVQRCGTGRAERLRDPDHVGPPHRPPGGRHDLQVGIVNVAPATMRASFTDPGKRTICRP